MGHCEGASDGVTVFLWDVLESCAGSYHWLRKVTAVRKGLSHCFGAPEPADAMSGLDLSPGGGDPVSMVGRGGGRAQMQPCLIARGDSPAQPRTGSCSPCVTARHALCVTSSSSSHPAAPDTAVWGSADNGPTGTERTSPSAAEQHHGHCGREQGGPPCGNQNPAVRWVLAAVKNKS